DEAIALDSSFGMAWRKLAVADPSRRDTAARRAYELRDRLTERERYHAIGLYHHYVTADYEEAAIAYRALLDAYPDDATALNNLAVTYADLGQLELAAEMQGRAARADPYAAPFRENHVYALYKTGQIDSARAILETFAADFPDHPRVTWLQTFFAYASGEIERSEDALDPLLSSAIPSVRRNAAGYMAQLRIVEGRLREAERLWRASREEPTALDEAIWKSGLDLTVRADTAGAVDRLSEAVRVAPDSVLDDNVGMVSTLFYLVGDVERGDRYRARELSVDSLRFANMPERFRRMQEAIHRFQRNLATSEYSDALAAYREASSLGHRLFPDEDPAGTAQFAIPAFEALGQPDSVIARYETWLGRRELDDRAKQDARFLHRAHERLAQLYDAMGETEKAAVHYARFVELWKDADPELQPRVEAARERLEEVVRERG
ncbi:MAG: tetratricopeptide repeat protein, partial [Gemmatimonadota bacterium]